MPEENAPDNSRNQHRPFWENFCADSKERLTAKALRFAKGNIYDAEDLVQGTVCRILMYPRNPENIRSPFGYLLTIMRNIWITTWYKEKREKASSLDELLSKEAQQKQHRSVEPGVEPAVHRILDNRDYEAELRAKQGPLTPREKLLLTLHLEGYTCAEIGLKLKEDVRLVAADINAMRTKVANRIKNAKR